MATIITLNAGDQITNSRADINTSLANLNSDKMETSVLDTDTSLAANSDAKVATQKAVKTYIDTAGGANASETVRGIVEEATDAEVTAGTATGGTGAKLFVTPAKLATRLTAVAPKVEIDTTDVTVTNGAGAENTMITAAIPANTLGTNSAIRYTAYFSNLSSGGGEYFTLRVKYGGTTFASFTENPSGITITGSGEVTGMIVADGATNLQKAYANLDVMQTTFNGEDAGSATVVTSKLHGYTGNMALAIDSTASQNLVITLEYSGTNGGNDATCEFMVVEAIR